MKKIFYFSVVLFFIFSCSALRKETGNKCKLDSEDQSFSKIIQDQRISVIGKDTLIFTEVRFQCTKTAFATKKSMYDEFGKWDNAIYSEEKEHPVLYWEGVKLLSDQTNEFSVFASGEENDSIIYSSILIFDKNGRDILNENSPLRSKVIERFTEMILYNNIGKKDFFEVYSPIVDPEKRKKNP